MNGLSFYASGIRPKGRIELKDSQIQRLLFTKTKAWEYEKEWRYVESSNGSFDLPGSIQEIVFGMKCKKSDIEAIITLCEKSNLKNVGFRQAFIAAGSDKLQLGKLKYNK